MMLTTPAQIHAYRHAVLVRMLKLEMRGMRHSSRGPSAFAILKRETGYPARTRREMFHYLLQQHQTQTQTEVTLG